jgi:hypothetical protein
VCLASEVTSGRRKPRARRIVEPAGVISLVLPASCIIGVQRCLEVGQAPSVRGRRGASGTPSVNMVAGPSGSFVLRDTSAVRTERSRDRAACCSRSTRGRRCSPAPGGTGGNSTRSTGRRSKPPSLAPRCGPPTPRSRRSVMTGGRRLGQAAAAAAVGAGRRWQPGRWCHRARARRGSRRGAAPERRPRRVCRAGLRDDREALRRCARGHRTPRRDDQRVRAADPEPSRGEDGSSVFRGDGGGAPGRQPAVASGTASQRSAAGAAYGQRHPP